MASPIQEFKMNRLVYGRGERLIKITLNSLARNYLKQFWKKSLFKMRSEIVKVKILQKHFISLFLILFLICDTASTLNNAEPTFREPGHRIKIETCRFVNKTHFKNMVRWAGSRMAGRASARNILMFLVLPGSTQRSRPDTRLCEAPNSFQTTRESQLCPKSSWIPFVLSLLFVF